jgi:predicted dehydrogenase
MRKDKSKVNQPIKNEQSSIKRRTVLKALVGIPVLGVFAFELINKREHDIEKKNSLIEELGLDNFIAPNVASTAVKKTNLIRIGIIGFGNRATSHANALGYMHPDDVESHKRMDTLKDWLLQENLNVALTGICDVFDLHAERGLETARNTLHPGVGQAVDLPVKRYQTYQEMIDDKDIDAVMIAAPDHHHAAITIAAAKAGKHVYCEKSPAHDEVELSEMYSAVKNSNIVYQLGHQVHQNAVFQRAKEIIDREILGKITLIETTTNRNSADGAWIRNLDENGNPKPGNEKSIDWNQWLGNAPKVPFSLDRFYNWTKFFDYDTGLIGQLFTHEYDAVNQLLKIGIPKSVVASGGIYYWKDNRDIPDVLNCVFEYPERELTLLYSACLANSRSRGRIFMGNHASMELGNTITIIADEGAARYNKHIEKGVIITSEPMVSFNQSSEEVDVVTSATAKYYASRGLTTTNFKGRNADVTYLHIREWINCIRNREIPSCNIELAFEEGITCIMAHKAYVEKRRVEWDSVNKRIV